MTNVGAEWKSYRINWHLILPTFILGQAFTGAHRLFTGQEPRRAHRNVQTAAFIFGARGYGTGTNILIGRIGKLSHFWFLENVSVDDWQDLCLLSILHYFNKNFSEKKCKKFHVNYMLLSERIGVRVSWQSCDACHVILRIKRFCHFQFRLSSAASSGGLTIMQFSLILVIFSFISLSQAVLR